MHENCKLLFQNYALEYFQPGTKVLEIGPDKIPSTLQEMVSDVLPAWDTVDIIDCYPITHLATSEYNFPIASNFYDVVLAANVIEHVRKIWIWIKEVTRVCKVGGTVIIIVPVSWAYHPAPHDCWRIYPQGMRALFDEAGLEELLVTWQSLEAPGYARYLPGVSAEFLSPKRRLANKLLGCFGYPVERAYDTIGIGRKIIATEA